jgi:hypothetical protein
VRTVALQPVRTADPTPAPRGEEEGMWYGAHIVMVFRYRNRRQRKFTVWENVVLIRAKSDREAWERAEEYGRADAEHDDPR